MDVALDGAVVEVVGSLEAEDVAAAAEWASTGAAMTTAAGGARAGVGGSVPTIEDFPNLPTRFCNLATTALLRSAVFCVAAAQAACRASPLPASRGA